MKTLSLSLMSVVMAGVAVSPATACDLCSIYAAADAQGGGGPGFFGGAAEQFTYFGTLQNDGHRVATMTTGDARFIKSSVSQVFAGYSFNDRFSLQFNLPIISRSYASDVAYGSDTGIGDVSLIGNFRILQRTYGDFIVNWTALGGIKLPTGDSHHLGDPDFAAGIGGHDLALGSGSVDGVVGTGFSAVYKRVFLTGNMQYAIRSEGAFGHQYANDWTWSGGPGMYLLLAHHYTLSAQAVVSGESKGKDTFSGVPDDDSAERIVYVGPQINFTWESKLSAQVGFDLPVIRAEGGEQIVPDYKLRVAVSWRF